MKKIKSRAKLPEPLLKVAEIFGIKLELDKNGLYIVTLPKGINDKVKKELMSLDGKNGVKIKSESYAPKRITILPGSNNINRGHYEFEEIFINLPDHDCDLRIWTPNMGTMIFQHRIEGPSVDICLTEPKVAYLQDSDLSPGKKRKGLPDHARVTEQITII
jgi:hypothetical protein